jgi:hypothetical protein
MGEGRRSNGLMKRKASWRNATPPPQIDRASRKLLGAVDEHARRALDKQTQACTDFRLIDLTRFAWAGVWSIGNPLA